MRLVLDTNVLIAAFISHGGCNELLEHCVIHHDVILSPFILNELQEKLVHKFKYSEKEAEAVVHLLQSSCEIVQAQAFPVQLSRDADDDNILAAAMTGNCSHIITGDNDLLDLKKVGDIEIISPNEFWKIEIPKE
jgi:putative PIN family toxin of toxin-antitoxin system